ncbi:MAG: hypothetical protein MZW92_05565 [Comamonadaceae bacterium]|nr:hypothetical protein [Comamonadaceae bacterium]
MRATSRRWTIPLALDLLDTLLHELLHKHSGLLRQLRDTFRRHPDVCDEAARLTRLLADDYVKRRSDVAEAMRKCHESLKICGFRRLRC